VTDSLNYQKQIEEQNRDLSDFAYMVSHDLKAPIFTIKGMADALTEDYSESLADDGRELVEYIVSATERLERLVESVIEYSSISTKELKEVEVDLNEALTSVTADLQELIRTNSATVDVQTNLGTVTGSPVRIYQVFSNLVGNAIKYRAPERDPHVTISAHSLASGGLKVDVTDNGLGIPTDKLDEVFRPYRRVHAGVAEGSGIGLACVKKIVDHLNGTVSVQSKEGVGSTFTVIFPGPPTAAQGIPKDLQRLYKDS
jgi:signal transduction histidine kinase